LARQSIRIWGLRGIPEINPGDNLSRHIAKAFQDAGGVENTEAQETGRGVILIVAQKVVSKAEGCLVRLAEVTPSTRAKVWAKQHRKDARIIEIVLREAKRVVRMDRGVVIVETRHGFVCANGGVDVSNAPTGSVVTLPRDPDQSARRLRQDLEKVLGLPIAVIISDTFGRPWRQGLTNVALGVSGLSPLIDYRGQLDSYGRELRATVLAVADELAAAGELVMGKTLGIPVAVIEGFSYRPAEGSGRDLIRPGEEDLFR
jgi:coenzyme F420-0:L-glutamate ligase / coenzyme F420-1:gamma-L-glutamate ligase